MTTVATLGPQTTFLFGHDLKVIALHAIWASDWVWIRHTLAVATIALVRNDRQGVFRLQRVLAIRMCQFVLRFRTSCHSRPIWLIEGSVATGSTRDYGFKSQLQHLISLLLLLLLGAHGRTCHHGSGSNHKRRHDWLRRDGVRGAHRNSHA